MPIDLTLPLIEEASADALVALMQSKIGDLNTMLSRDSLMTDANLATVVSSQVLRGDGLAIPAGVDLWFAVQGGEKGSGLHLNAGLEQAGESDGRGYLYRYYALISGYLSPKAAFATNSVAHTTLRERLLDRMSGWIRLVCFNNKDGLLITLGSREYAAAPDFDQMKGGATGEIYRGAVGKGEEENISCPAVLTVYEGMI